MLEDPVSMVGIRGMWTEAVKNFAQEGKGNVIYLDGSVDGLQKTMKDMMAINMMNQPTGKK